jgi:hypothetical protein
MFSEPRALLVVPPALSPISLVVTRADTKAQSRSVWTLRRLCAIGTKGFVRQQAENTVYLT